MAKKAKKKEEKCWYILEEPTGYTDQSVFETLEEAESYIESQLEHWDGIVVYKAQLVEVFRPRAKLEAFKPGGPGGW
jgi:hypothetical protein